VKRINNAFQRADQIQRWKARANVDYYLPIVADAEAGFGGALNAHEIMKAFIEAGAAGVHFEDQLASEKKCGHMGGKVLIPTKTAIRNLIAARLAADLLGVPTLIVARTDANGAQLITSDVDPADRPFITGERTEEGFYPPARRTRRGDRARPGLRAVRRPDLVRDLEPNIEEARRFADEIHAQFPGKWLAYNCSPSFNWKLKLAEATSRRSSSSSRRWATNSSSSRWPASTRSTTRFFQLAKDYKPRGMAAYSELQQAEFAAEPDGYTATRHQREVGTGYFDEIAQVVAEGK
jgi:isocitrate lyase